MVDLGFFKKIVAFAKEHDVIVIHDLAYADLVFDGYKAPSFCKFQGPRMSASSSIPSPRPTTCPVGAWAFVAVIARLSEPWLRSRATWIMGFSSLFRSPASLPSMDRKIVSRRRCCATRSVVMCW